MSRDQFLKTLDVYARDGRTVQLWLRDDDAIEPTAPLSHLLDLSARWNAPMTIAAIPAHATDALADLLKPLPTISVAVHGWDHVNHAPASEKKQELGLHRGEETVLARLADGLTRINALFDGRAVPLLVPPWNRIAAKLIPHLPGLGYKALSVFGPERGESPLPLVNTHVDIIDWKGAAAGDRWMYSMPRLQRICRQRRHLRCRSVSSLTISCMTRRPGSFSTTCSRLRPTIQPAAGSQSAS